MREMYNVTTNRKGCFNMKTNIKDETYEQYSLSGDSSPANYRNYIIHALYAFAGFCFSQLDALGEISPFTLSFLSAMKFDFCFPVFIFSCLGVVYIFRSEDRENGTGNAKTLDGLRAVG